MEGAEILGLASGGGHKCLFYGSGARCTVLDYSEMQLLKEKEVAERENYEIKLVKADMTKPLPFEDESFDLIFHPFPTAISRMFIPLEGMPQGVEKRGILLAGLDNGINFILMMRRECWPTSCPSIH